MNQNPKLIQKSFGESDDLFDINSNIVFYNVRKTPCTYKWYKTGIAIESRQLCINKEYDCEKIFQGD